MMGNKKEIGKYFKEKLAATEIQPNDVVWNEIDRTLRKKRKYRFLIFILLFFILSGIGGFTYWYIAKERTNTTTPTSNKNNEPISQKQNNKAGFHTTDSTSIPVLGTDKRQDTSQDAVPNIKISSTQEQSGALPNVVMSTSNTSSKSKNTKITQFSGPSKNYKNDVSNRDPGTSKSPLLPENETSLFKATQKDTIDTDPTILASTKSTSSVVPSKNLDPASGQKQPEIIDSLSKKERTKTGSKKKRKPKPKKEEEEEEIVGFLNNFAISIQAGPAYYDYLSKEYPLFTTTINDKKKNDISFVYGALFNFPLNKKSVFRFGFKQLHLNYSFADITSTININGRPALFASSKIAPFSNRLEQRIQNEINNGTPFDVTHNIRYWEVPLEISHTIRDKKIKIDILAGFNLHIFRDNTISISIENHGSFPIGSANYFKKQAFAIHAGAGFRYRITKGVQLDVEPTLRYQFNSFIQGTGNFNPYYFSILSGVTLKL